MVSGILSKAAGALGLVDRLQTVDGFISVDDSILWEVQHFDTANYDGKEEHARGWLTKSPRSPFGDRQVY
jgi:hypothetical protein